MQALLLRRPGLDGEPAHRDLPEVIGHSVDVVANLQEVTSWVEEHNSRISSF